LCGEPPYNPERSFEELRHGLYAELKSRGLPASELLQVAVQAEIERQDTLHATDEYPAELAASLSRSEHLCGGSAPMVRFVKLENLRGWTFPSNANIR
jgi:hypothetical protein